MKRILISFIRNEHFTCLKENNHRDLDISKVADSRSIDRIFLLTNQDREKSITFKNWIGEKLGLEVKAVTLEKGSEKYILGKIESIIKYILLAEEGHATFFYLPGENTLQINLWEIVRKTVHRGEIIYPQEESSPSVSEPEPEEIKKTIVKQPSESKPGRSVSAKVSEKPISAVSSNDSQRLKQIEDKAIHAFEQGMNLMICGEEGTGKRTFAESHLQSRGIHFKSVNFRSVNPAMIDDEISSLSSFGKGDETRNHWLLLLNIEVLPDHAQERLTELTEQHIVSTLNIREKSDPDHLNKKFYYLLSRTIITLAPLRTRRDEFPVLAGKVMEDLGISAELSENAMDHLMRHNWPGNFNEFRSVLSRANSEGVPVISEEQIIVSIDKPEGEMEQWRSIPMGENFNLNDVLGEVAMHYILLALEICDGKKSKAARMLGFSNYQTLSNWMKKYDK